MTTTTWRAELPYIKVVRPPEILDYSVCPKSGNQARHKNRVVAEPVVDLREYTCRADIDWLDVSVVLTRPTQFQHLQKPIAERTGLVPFVDAQDKGAGSAATIFRIRFQEARLALVAECIEDIRCTHGFLREPAIVGLEVSVDFTPKIPSEPARHRMVGVLTHHLFPKTDILADPYDRPRFKWGRGKARTRYLVGERRRRPQGLDLLRWPIADLPAPVDATFYAGRLHGRAQWKVMDKILDRQNPATGTRIVLPEEKKRARVEVTLNQEELLDLGIRSVENLGRFSFSTLQGRYFQFMLPTFATKSVRLRTAVVSYWENIRKRRFLNAGVVGVVLLDQSTEGFHRSSRVEVLARIKALGRKVAPAVRSGSGETRTFVAYAELNKKVSRALERLSERERLPAVEEEHRVGEG